MSDTLTSKQIAKNFQDCIQILNDRIKESSKRQTKKTFKREAAFRTRQRKLRRAYQLQKTNAINGKLGKRNIHFKVLSQKLIKQKNRIEENISDINSAASSIQNSIQVLSFLQKIINFMS